MVNNLFKSTRQAVVAGTFLAALCVAAHAQTVRVSAEPASHHSEAAFIKKNDRLVPALGEGVTMGKPEQTTVEKPADETSEAISRSKKFVYHFTKPQIGPENGNGETIVLLHGSGGDETSLIPFAQKVWPRATLLGIRGRIQQEGRTRWYARITPVKFDQKDVRVEADAFVRFLAKLADEDRLDLSRTTFVGYSNGANLLAAAMMLHPGLVKKAILMRSMPVLDQTPVANLSKAKILVVTGKDDKMYAPFAPALSGLLRSSGAKVDARIVEAGHMIGDHDIELVSAWLSGQGPDGGPAMTQATSEKSKK